MQLRNDPRATEAFRRRRDHLLRHRGDLDAARRNLPTVELEHFNWSFDWFDPVAHDRAGPALVMVKNSLAAETVTYRDLADCSCRAAAWLHEVGVCRGDRVLVLLDNRIELWELILASI